MENIIKSVDTVDDKDKLIKVIQNLSRILSFTVQYSNKQLSNNLNAMSVFARDSRKMFSMFKSIESLHCLNLCALKKTSGKNSCANTYDYFSHLTKCFYYLFDNIQLLCGFNLLPLNKGYVTHLSLLFWAANILCGLVKHFHSLYDLIVKRQEMIKNNSESDLTKINYEILNCFIDASAKIGDLITAFNGLGLSEVMFNRRIDTIASIGGLYAGMISLWRTFNKVTTKDNMNMGKNIEMKLEEK